MPPRPVQGVGDTNTVLSFYWDIPPVTRAMFTAFGVLKLISVLGILPIPYWSFLSWQLIFQHWQVWRIITPFLLISGKGFEALILLIWTVQYGKVLETSVFMNRTADFVWMLIIVGGSMLGLSLVPFLYLPLLGNSLIEAMLYVWSRHFPTMQVNLFGLVPVQAFYLPFAYVGLTIFMGGSWKTGVLGILAGHIYYYFATLYPASTGRRLIQTPGWLTRLLRRTGIGNPVTPEVNSNATASGFRAFSGAGHRLG